MTVHLDIHADEESTYVVEASFTDHQDPAQPVTPATLLWSLTDTKGRIVNSREDVAITGGDLDTSVDIILTGADLAILTTAPSNERRFVIKATYIATEGALNLTGSASFTIDNLVGVS